MLQSRTINYLLRRFSIALLFLVPISAAAIPVADYQRNLQRAITALDTLLQSDENERIEDYENRLDQTFAAVRDALPEHEPVPTGDEVCTVDNSWLHAALKEIKESSADHRPDKLAQLIERLRAIEERVGYAQRPATATESKAYTKQKLESILARPEYVSAARGPNALNRLLMDFIRWLQQFLPKPLQVRPGRASSLSVIAQVLVVIVALLVLFFVVKTLLHRFQRARKPRAPKKQKARIVLGEQLEPDDTATDLLAEAEAMARRGELRAAIRKAYIALLVELGDRKVISLAHHKTNRDYLNAVRNLPPLHSRMRGLTDSFERHWYGFVDVTDNDWQDFRAGYRAALQTGN